MKKIYKISAVFLMLMQPMLVLSAEKTGVATFNYTSIGEYKLNKDIIRSKALRSACKNAFKQYVATFDKAKKKNYKKVKREIEDNLPNYMSCSNIVDEQHFESTQSLKIAVKAEIDSDSIELKINESSKISQEGSDRTIAILMIVRKTTGADIKDDRIRTVGRDTNIQTTTTTGDRKSEADGSYTKDNDKSVNTNQIEAVDESSVISSSNTGTAESGDFKRNSSSTNDENKSKTTINTNIRESGGGRIVSATKFKYEIADGLEEAIESGMLENLEENGFDVMGLDNYDDNVLDVYEEIKKSYNESNRIPKKLTRKIKKAFEADGGTDCYVTGSFDIGIRETDSATGNILKNVLVKSAKLECYMAKKEGAKKRWKRMASVSGVQAKGLGTTEPEAEQNAIANCAGKVGKKLLDKINARGIN